MYTLLTFNAAVAIYALVRLLTDPRSVKPIGSQFREYLHAWRTNQVVELEPTEGSAIRMRPLTKLDGEPGYLAIVGHRYSVLRRIWPGLCS